MVAVLFFEYHRPLLFQTVSCVGDVVRLKRINVKESGSATPCILISETART